LTDAIDGVRVRVLPDGRMDRENAARYLGRKPKTLAMWALRGKGPRLVKVAGRIFYFREVIWPGASSAAKRSASGGGRRTGGT